MEAAREDVSDGKLDVSDQGWYKESALSVLSALTQPESVHLSIGNQHERVACSSLHFERAELLSLEHLDLSWCVDSVDLAMTQLAVGAIAPCVNFTIVHARDLVVESEADVPEC